MALPKFDNAKLVDQVANNFYDLYITDKAAVLNIIADEMDDPYGNDIDYSNVTPLLRKAAKAITEVYNSEEFQRSLDSDEEF
jgi:uncharacterized protein YpuA (DUF1002 family)